MALAVWMLEWLMSIQISSFDEPGIEISFRRKDVNHRLEVGDGASFREFFLCTALRQKQCASLVHKHISLLRERMKPPLTNLTTR